MIIIHDVCCAFEEPHATVNVVLPYRFSSKPIELSCHLLAVRVYRFQQGVLVHQFGARHTDRNHTNVMVSFTIEFGNEFFLPCC